MADSFIDRLTNEARRRIGTGCIYHKKPDHMLEFANISPFDDNQLIICLRLLRKFIHRRSKSTFIELRRLLYKHFPKQVNKQERCKNSEYDKWEIFS